MNAHELKTIAQRKLILQKIRDDFNGSARQNAIAIAVSGCRTSRGVIANLNWLVEHGYLTLERKDNWTKTYTLTEKVT